MIQVDIAKPITPAPVAIRMLSVAKRRTRRPRLAPRARWIAISLRRRMARASTMLATLAHAISITNPAMIRKNDVKNGKSCLRSVEKLAACSQGNASGS